MSRVISRCLALILGFAAAVHAATPVKVKMLSEVWQPLSYTAPATVVNEHHALLSNEIAAVLRTLPVRVGDQVKKGTVIAELECSDYKLMLTQAEQQARVFKSQLSLAEQQSRRISVLQSSGSASKELLDQRRTEVDGLKAQLSAQQAQVSQAIKNTQRCQVVAPFDGVVTQVIAAPGSCLAVGSPLLRLLDPQSVEVSVSLSAAHVKSIQQASSIVLKVGTEEFLIQLRAVVPLMATASKTQELRFSFQSANTAMTGFTGEVLWQVPDFILPASYLVNKDGRLGVMLLKEQHAEFLPLPNARGGQPVIINLPASSQLIVQGQHVLKHGDAVTVGE